MSDTQTSVCERCLEETETVVGCSFCARLICPKCEAAAPNDLSEPLCEECF